MAHVAMAALLAPMLLLCLACGELGVSSDQKCLENIECAATNDDWNYNAEVHCGPPIEAQAPYGFRWTDAYGGYKFDQIIGHTNGRALFYQGSEIEFEDTFGDWRRMRYVCLFDPINNLVGQVAVHLYD